MLAIQYDRMLIKLCSLLAALVMMMVLADAVCAAQCACGSRRGHSRAKSGCDCSRCRQSCDDFSSDSSPGKPSDTEPDQEPSDDMLEPTEDPDRITEPPDTSDDFPSISPGDFAQSFGGEAGQVGVPSMIGDFFSNAYNYSFLSAGPTGAAPSVAVGGGDRQYKWAENNSPFPTNRFFFNYHHFHNAVIDINGSERNVDRYTFGLERTFLDGWVSAEVRVPFANTVKSNPVAFVDTDLDATEFGRLAFAFKALLARSDDCAVSIGLGLVLPTGDDYVVSGDVDFNRFENGSLILEPFLGIYHAPHRSVFSQFFLQADFDATGSDVVVDSTSGTLQTQSLLMLDYSVGYWLCERRSSGIVRGIAPMLELHYTTTLEDQDYGPFRGMGVFVEDDRRDVLNITGGLFFQLGTNSTLKVGAVSPLRDGTDKLFDSEIGVQFARYY